MISEDDKIRLARMLLRIRHERIVRQLVRTETEAQLRGQHFASKGYHARQSCLAERKQSSKDVLGLEDSGDTYARFRVVTVFC